MAPERWRRFAQRARALERAKAKPQSSQKPVVPRLHEIAANRLRLITAGAATTSDGSRSAFGGIPPPRPSEVSHATLRPLGNSPLSIAPLAFGGNVFGWSADEKRSFELLDAFVDAGFNLIDTADVYSAWVPGNRGGESETIIGKWLQAQRQARQGGDRHQGREVGEHPGLSPMNIRRPSTVRCSACRPTTSISTRRTRTMPACRCTKRSARLDG
jgi:hypothetical protein